MDGWLAGWVDDVDEDETDAVCGVCFGCVILRSTVSSADFFSKISIDQ